MDVRTETPPPAFSPRQSRQIGWPGELITVMDFAPVADRRIRIARRPARLASGLLSQPAGNWRNPSRLATEGATDAALPGDGTYSSIAEMSETETLEFVRRAVVHFLSPVPQLLRRTGDHPCSGATIPEAIRRCPRQSGGASIIRTPTAGRQKQHSEHFIRFNFLPAMTPRTATLLSTTAEAVFALCSLFFGSLF
jgi:hypothetical protein